MRLFCVDKGTKSFLIRRTTENGYVEWSVREWIVRHPLQFTEVLVDPIRLLSIRGGHTTSSGLFAQVFIDLAQQGYVVFGGEDGGDPEAKYSLAVPFYAVCTR